MLVHVNTPSLIIHWLSGCNGSRIISGDESGDLYVGPHLNIENFPYYFCPLFVTNCPWVQLQVTVNVSINSKSVVEPDRRKQWQMVMPKVLTRVLILSLSVQGMPIILFLVQEDCCWTASLSLGQQSRWNFSCYLAQVPTQSWKFHRELSFSFW